MDLSFLSDEFCIDSLVIDQCSWTVEKKKLFSNFSSNKRDVHLCLWKFHVGLDNNSVNIPQILSEKYSFLLGLSAISWKAFSERHFAVSSCSSRTWIITKRKNREGLVSRYDKSGGQNDRRWGGIIEFVCEKILVFYTFKKSARQKIHINHPYEPKTYFLNRVYCLIIQFLQQPLISTQ